LESALRNGAGEPGLRLIETLAWDGTSAPRLDGHQARLTASAVRLGWPGPGDLADHLTDLPAHPLRLRLTFDAFGRIERQTAPMPAALPVWRVGLAAQRLHSGDPWLSVKSTRRAAYDAARADLTEGLDEVLLLNERGEVCDGSITTLFFDRGQGLRTPPLTSGLLPGVLRAEMGVAEEVLMARDLPQVRLWLGNALRGLSPAVWQGA
jgi:4-amino-4-deoxychorismate lyase